MTARLTDFAFIPRQHGGWGTPLYRFGRGTTLVTGENGAGKTPILRGVAFALGGKIELPAIITAHCEGVRLSLADTSGRTIVVRKMFDGGRATFDDGGRSHSVSKDEDFSSVMLQLLGIQPRSLVRRSDNQPVPPYVSLLTPLFIVDQDNGWRDLYGPPPNLNFVQDQTEECLRWILDVPQRNSSRPRQERADARQKADVARERFEHSRRLIETMRSEAGDDARDGMKQSLEEMKRAATVRLTALIGDFSGLAAVDSSVDAELRAAEARRERADRGFATAVRQRSALQRTREELIAETNVLEGNEVAANVFREFCGNSDCNLFRPQDSYGRRLLYLKDQLKDIDTSASLLEADVAAAEAMVAQCGRDSEVIRHRLRMQAAASAGEQLVAEIESLTRELAALTVRIERLRTIDAERVRLAELMGLVQKAEEEVTAMASVRSANGGDRLIDARTIMARNSMKWLTALHARNVGAEVQFDVNLQPHIGGERFSPASSQSGSTRTRIVLALHAALVETSLEMKGQHPGLLILDAPKQHELHPQDLAAFVSACENLFAKQHPPMQLIVGAKERDIFVNRSETVWEPTFKDQDGDHYLGSLESKG